MNHVYNLPESSTKGKVKKWLAFFIGVTIAVTASAQNYTLTSNGDTHAVTPASSPLDAGGQITLRSALEAATAIAGTHIVTIPASITTINISLGQITVGNAAAGNNITINGPGKAVLTINQTTAARVFFTGVGAITFAVNDLTINYSGPAGSFSGGGGAILAGGINAVTSMTNVAINNFAVQIGNGGALSCSTANTNGLTLTNCDFNNNKCGGGGGAVSYVGNSTCVITNCTFNNNSTGPLGANTGGGGGALSTSGSGNGGTYTVTNCTFTNNHAQTQGGAALNTNGALTMTFCRFVNNTATVATDGNTLAQTGGASVQTINSNNNWWGVNAPTANDNVVLAAGGTITCTKWLQLKLTSSSGSFCSVSSATITASFLSNSAGEAVTTANISRLIGLPISFSPALGTISGAQTTIQANGTATATFTGSGTAGTGTVNGIVDNVPNNDATAKTSFTLTTSPSITSNPSASTQCAGLSASFTAAAAGNTSVVWQESASAGFPSPTTLSNTGIYSGATSTTLTISDNSTVNGKYYRLVASNSNGCPSASSAGALLTATTPTLSGNNTVTQTVGNANNNYYAASCGAICKIVPLGSTSPITGNVTTQVWVEGAVPNVSGQPFVQRHYQITPATSPATAAATVTLYFSQAEFDNFNAAPGSTKKLPTSSGDATGKANLRVSKYSGSSNNGSGLPASYTSGAIVIDPPDASIIYNSAFSRWEVTIDVTGFSGFFVQTALNPLAIKLLSFTATYNNSSTAINWEIAQPEDGNTFIVLRSMNGIDFNPISSATGDNVKTKFNYTDAALTFTGKIYYRLQMTDKDGKTTYSDIIFVKAGNDIKEITVYPNPVQNGANIKINLQNVKADKLELYTTSGQLIWSNQKEITGNYSIRLPFILARDIYWLKIFTNDGVERRKVLIE